MNISYISYDQIYVTNPVMKYLKNSHPKFIEEQYVGCKYVGMKKSTSKNKFIFHLVKVLQNILYYPWNLKL